jgi:hypothetical protein
VITLVITDGRREYLERTLAAAGEMIPGFLPVFVNDSGDGDYCDWLNTLNAHSVHHPERRGMAAAVRTALSTVVSTTARYAFYLEEDFVLTAPVQLDAMIATLDAYPRLSQLVLKRQPWSDEEKNAGGQIEVAPTAYEDRDGFVEHKRLFSFNPSLMRVEACEKALQDPGSNGLEAGITQTLVREGYSFAFWCARTDPPRCEHIGEARSADYRW